MRALSRGTGRLCDATDAPVQSMTMMMIRLLRWWLEPGMAAAAGATQIRVVCRPLHHARPRWQALDASFLKFLTIADARAGALLATCSPPSAVPNTSNPQDI